MGKAETTEAPLPLPIPVGQNYYLFSTKFLLLIFLLNVQEAVELSAGGEGDCQGPQITWHSENPPAMVHRDKAWTRKVNDGPYGAVTMS